ncbi:alkanesulfonate monooxygenase [Paenibacillus algorifonticola]|uniref:Alkanesulfonate monooxygenase n=1 Tax=Paenibacillus algorifonticola TaxID=684063 RepID=A0A1I2IBD9_9BACL|nr:LLM class flavin-dependent oxidoreductase [Paenibacillus algorifonticola]SFF39679.1 alkanesulfonate monooxygenase [Paenibacillus algorifonticola]
MAFCWMLPQGDLHRITEQTRAAEGYGFDSVLLINANDYMDPWIAASYLAERTEKLRFLIAQNTSYILPTAAAKALGTLNLLTGGRADINVVTGSSAIETGRMTKAASHEQRYERTKEFIELFHRLQEGETIHFRGSWFEVNQGELYPKPSSRGSVFISGSSPEAMQIAAAGGHHYLTYGHDYPVVSKRLETFRGYIPKASLHRPKCGIMIDIIARETTESAWAAAERFLGGTSAIEKRTNRLFRNNCDAAGIQSYKAHYADPMAKVSEHLWAGLVQLNTSNGFSIVGSYEEVRQSIQKFRQLGVDYFILSGLAGPDEQLRIGEYILPYVRGNGESDGLSSVGKEASSHGNGRYA